MGYAGPPLPAAIGTPVPGSGNAATNGIFQAGDGISKYSYTWPALVVGPRGTHVAPRREPNRQVDLLTYGSPAALPFDPTLADRHFAVAAAWGLGVAIATWSALLSEQTALQVWPATRAIPRIEAVKIPGSA